jgi:putative phosphoesterase
MTSAQTLVSRDSSNYEVTKIVGLISDTHIPARANRIPKRVFEIFEHADFIIHAGDLVELKVIDELEQIAPVLAVQGNMDGPEIANALPTLDSLKVFDWKITVGHDLSTLHNSDKIEEIVKHNDSNVFVYGHTHVSSIRWEGPSLFINPGSPTDPVSYLSTQSVGLLKITRERITPYIVNL